MKGNIVRYEVDLPVPGAILDMWEAMLLCEDIDYEKEGFRPLDCVWCQTAKFPDGTEMDVKVCTNEIEDRDAWSEAVLFTKDGGEIGHTDVCDSLRGEWSVSVFGKDGTEYVYVANVKDYRYEG